MAAVGRASAHEIVLIVPEHGMLVEVAGLCDIFARANHALPESSKLPRYAWQVASTTRKKTIEGSSGLRVVADAPLTGAAKAIGKVLPELDGRLSGFSLRLPVPVVSVVDRTVQVERATDVATVNAAFREAAAEPALAGILGVSEEPLVSADFQGDPRS